MKILTIFFILLTVCGSGSAKKQETQGVKKYSFTVHAVHPHDTGAYTQGLFWHDGAMWESTGEYGRSTMREIDLDTGSVVRQVALSDNYFGEGAAIMDGKIYQLTWLNQRAFVYNPETLERLGEFKYRGEGWGLTTDGQVLYMSDGTANISIVDPVDFSVIGTIVVRHEGQPLDLINELEWIDGRIWANVYMTNTIVVIDPQTGNIEGEIDFSALTAQLEITETTDVMNGIAHDPKGGKTWVTGKNWNKLFEIKISN